MHCVASCRIFLGIHPGENSNSSATFERSLRSVCKVTGREGAQLTAKLDVSCERAKVREGSFVVCKARGRGEMHLGKYASTHN